MSDVNATLRGEQARLQRLCDQLEKREQLVIPTDFSSLAKPTSAPRFDGDLPPDLRSIREVERLVSEIFPEEVVDPKQWKDALREHVENRPERPKVIDLDPQPGSVAHVWFSPTQAVNEDAKGQPKRFAILEGGAVRRYTWASADPPHKAAIYNIPLDGKYIGFGLMSGAPLQSDLAYWQYAFGWYSKKSFEKHPSDLCIVLADGPKSVSFISSSTEAQDVRSFLDRYDDALLLGAGMPMSWTAWEELNERERNIARGVKPAEGEEWRAKVIEVREPPPQPGMMSLPGVSTISWYGVPPVSKEKLGKMLSDMHNSHIHNGKGEIYKLPSEADLKHRIRTSPRPGDIAYRDGEPVGIFR